MFFSGRITLRARTAPGIGRLRRLTLLHQSERTPERQVARDLSIGPWSLVGMRTHSWLKSYAALTVVLISHGFSLHFN